MIAPHLDDGLHVLQLQVGGAPRRQLQVDVGSLLQLHHLEWNIIGRIQQGIIKWEYVTNFQRIYFLSSSGNTYTVKFCS